MPIYAEKGYIFPAHPAFLELLEYERSEFKPEWCDSSDVKGHEEAKRYDSPQDFFRDTLLFCYQSIGLHIQGIHRPYIAKILEAATDKGAVTLLDVGSGGGQLALAMHELGFRISIADVWSKSLMFAVWRFARRGVDVTAFVLDAEPKPFVPPHQIVTCFDVLEHLSPEKQIELLNWMGTKGELVFCNLITDDDHPELHFPVDVMGLTREVEKQWPVELTGHYPDDRGFRQHLLVYGSGVRYTQDTTGVSAIYGSGVRHAQGRDEDAERSPAD